MRSATVFSLSRRMPRRPAEARAIAPEPLQLTLAPARTGAGVQLPIAAGEQLAAHIARLLPES